MRRIAAAAVALCAMLVSFAGARAQAPLDTASGIRHLANIPYTTGTDLAFAGRYAIAGDLDARDGDPTAFRIIDIHDPSNPAVVGTFACHGGQNDLSVWGSLVFVSVDFGLEDDSCDASWRSGQTYWSGVRIVDIADVRRPRLIANVRTECGSHTHTLVPDASNGRVLLYVQSAAPGTDIELQAGEDPACNRRTHNRNSIVEVPLADPAAARVIAMPSVGYESEGGPTEPLQWKGCHDVTVFLPRKLAGAACFDETQIWDISDPAAPKILAHIPTGPALPIDLHHSTAFSQDGTTLIIGDESGGSSGPACLTGADPIGALWFFDITDPANPVQKGFFSLPRPRGYGCTAHNFNVVPLRDRDVLVSAWYSGGINVVDFTDPAAPAEIAHQRFFGPNTGLTDARGSEAWSAYWYNGHVYVSDMARGFDVFAVDDPLVAGALSKRVENPQTQDGLPAAARHAPRAKPAAVRGVRDELPATGAGVPWGAALPITVAAVAGTRALRRPRSYRPNRGQ